MSKNWSGFSDPNNATTTPLGLVDVAECEELIQENKSEKKNQDSEYILQYIDGLKKKEADFYMSLNLDDKLKRNLFKINATKEEQPAPYSRKSDLVILQHPLEGNMIITQKDLNEKYGGQILN